MTHRIFALFVVTLFIVLGIGMIALGIDGISHSPIPGEDGRMTGIILVVFGVGLLGGAANGVKMNFFPKAPGHADVPTT